MLFFTIVRPMCIGKATYECSVSVLLLSPVVWPAQHDRIVFETAQSCSLNSTHNKQRQLMILVQQRLTFSGHLNLRFCISALFSDNRLSEILQVVKNSKSSKILTKGRICVKMITTKASNTY